MSAIDADRTGAEAPSLIMAEMLVAASFPMIPDGMPVRGGTG